MDRRQRFKGRGILTALLIAPRDFNYTNCATCQRTLYYTYVGEACPFCGTIVEDFQHGKLPTSAENGNRITAPKLRGRRRARRHVRRTERSPRSKRVDERAGARANPST